MWPLVAGADPHFEGFAWLNGSDPILGQHASMKEGVAGPIREFNEAKPFFGTEPFDDPADRWTGRGFHGCSVEPGSGSESTGLRLVGIGVEVATQRMTKISLSHLGSWGLSDQFRGATIRSVAGLIAGVLDTIRRWFDIQSAVRGSVNKVALQAARIKGRGKNRVGIVSALIGLSAAFEQSVGRFTLVTVSDAARPRLVE